MGDDAIGRRVWSPRRLRERLDTDEALIGRGGVSVAWAEITAAAGWINGASMVAKLGDLVVMHVEMENVQGAAGLMSILPAEFWPVAFANTPDSTYFVNGGDGSVTFNGDTTGSALRVLQLSYQAVS